MSPVIAVVLNRYLVPTLDLSPGTRAAWMRRDFVPVLGPKHRDVEHLLFDVEHYHIDWRFVTETEYRGAAWNDMPHGKVVGAVGKPVLRELTCLREMPEFPNVRELGWDPLGRWSSLERAFACKTLKDGHICPHRGIDLRPFAQEDGTAICPGHGLRWDLRTGLLMDRHSKAEAA